MLLTNGNKIEFENAYKILNKHMLKACIFSYRIYTDTRIHKQVSGQLFIQLK